MIDADQRRLVPEASLPARVQLLAIAYTIASVVFVRIGISSLRTAPAACDSCSNGVEYEPLQRRVPAVSKAPLIGARRTRSGNMRQKQGKIIVLALIRAFRPINSWRTASYRPGLLTSDTQAGSRYHPLICGRQVATRSTFLADEIFSGGMSVAITLSTYVGRSWWKQLMRGTRGAKACSKPPPSLRLALRARYCLSTDYVDLCLPSTKL